MREIVKTLVRTLALVAVLPRLASFAVAARILGRDRAIEGATQALARIPGLRGQYMRRAFLARTLERCAETSVVCWGTIFSKAGAIIDDNVYVGPGCHLGLVHLEADVLLAAGVHVPSGAQTHGTEDVERPIREQPGQLQRVRIGRGTWVGSAAVVMADVGVDSVVAAGAVVSRALPDRVIAGGVPARVIKERGPGAARLA